MGKIAAFLIVGALAMAVACSSGVDVEDVSGATHEELDRACEALEEVGYDFWELDVVSLQGRILEVAASIHALNPGPEQTEEFCEDR